jgi:hypothetical protein
MENKDDSACSCILLLAGTAFVIYTIKDIAEFFASPNAIPQILDCLKGLGLCIGTAVVLLAVGVIISIISSIEPKQKLAIESKEYLARCFFVEMEGSTYGPIPVDLPDVPGQESEVPIYLTVTATNLGPRLGPALAKANRGWSDDENLARFSRLSRQGERSFLIPKGMLSYYYSGTPLHEAMAVNKQQKSETTQEFSAEKGKLRFGPLPVDYEGDAIQIVLLFSAVMEVEEPRRILRRDKPGKLKIVVIDEDLCEDQPATRELYKVFVYESEPTDSEDDDSWMYRSRPIYW